MRTWSNPGGHFRQTLYFKPPEMDDMCVQALDQAGLLPAEPNPVRIERFIEKHFACRIAYEEVQEGVLGCTVFGNDGSIRLVAVSPKLEDGTKSGARRVRSTLAHEAGHCLMHPSLFMETETQMSLAFGGVHENLDFKSKRILCRTGDIAVTTSKYGGRWWEYQANRAIGGLLLPKKLVQKTIEPLLSATGSLGLKTLLPERRGEAERTIAEAFDVNPVVARIRLSEMYPVSQEAEL